MSREIGIQLGKKIRDLREAAGLTQAQLAALSLKSVETISNFERGKTIPSVSTLEAMAPHLNAKLRDFFDFDLKVHTKQTDPLTASITTKAKLLPKQDRQLADALIDLLLSRRRTKKPKS